MLVHLYILKLNNRNVALYKPTVQIKVVSRPYKPKCTNKRTLV